MLPRTPEWKNAIKAQFRRQAYLKFRLEVTPPDLKRGLQVTSSDTWYNSSVKSITDSNTEIPQRYFSFERNRGVLSSKTKFLRKEQKTQDWWAKYNQSGIYEVTFTFDKTYTIPGVYVEWDSETNSYPSKFSILGYSLDGNQKYKYNKANLTSPKGFNEAPMDNVKSVKLQINSWINPTWVPRINEVVLGVLVDFDSINNGRITKANVINSAQPLSDELPKSTVTITLRNMDNYFDAKLSTGISKYLARRQVASYQWGFMLEPDKVEWLPKLPIYINTFDIPQGSKDVKINLTSRMSFIAKKYKVGTIPREPVSLYDIAEEVLLNSGIMNDTTGIAPWELHKAMREFKTSAPIAADNTTVLLQRIALASACWLKIDMLTDHIKFVRPDATPTHEITQSQELGDPAAKINDKLRSISFGVYKYNTINEFIDVAIGTYNIAGTRVITIDYNVPFATEVVAQVQNATLQSATYYATCATLKLTAPVKSQNVTITLRGKEVKQSIAYIETFRNELVSDGTDVIIENPLITETDKLSELSNFVKKYYEKRATYKSQYEGYPELEAADTIVFASTYDQSNVNVVSNSIDFNGAWKGTIEVV